MFKKLLVGSLLFAILLTAQLINKAYTEEITDNNYPLQQNLDLYDKLNYDELVKISKDENNSESVKKDIDYVLNNAVVDNTISTDTTPRNQRKELGKFLRLTSWNIERGMELDEIFQIFFNPDERLKDLKDKYKDKADDIKAEMEELKNSDIFFLTEVDAGMPRTKYRHVAEEFAKKIGYNYAFAVEFLEVDPSHLGLENYKWSEERALYGNNPPEIDKDKYRGLHGSAILSKYPLKNVRILRLPLSYNWFTGERKRIASMESLKRHAAHKFFQEGVIREIRYGSRLALIADAIIPGLDTPLTVVVAHLENRTSPKKRKEQIKYALNYLREIKNPVVIAGDFNTAVANAAPRTKRSKIVSFLKHCEIYNIPTHFVLKPAAAIPNAFRKHDDPTVKSIPFLFSNPEEGLFKELKKFEFADDYHFDFRSMPGKFTGKKGNLADANERAKKGFVATFMFKRPIYFGKYKLDWFFVKPYIKDALDKDGSYRMAPHFGSTLFDLNFAFNNPISDHAPITVELPLEEPPNADVADNIDLKDSATIDE